MVGRHDAGYAAARAGGAVPQPHIGGRPARGRAGRPGRRRRSGVRGRAAGLVVVALRGEGAAARRAPLSWAPGTSSSCPGVGRGSRGGWIVAPGGAPLVGVLGAVGGVGATTVAAALATARGALLVDLDPDGAGLDLPLGSGRRARDPLGGSAGSAGAPGPRVLPRRAARARVRRRSSAGVVPGPRGGAGRLGAGDGTRAPDRSRVDLGRRDHHRALGPDDWLVLVTTATVAGVVAARRILDRQARRASCRPSGPRAGCPAPRSLAELRRDRWSGSRGCAGPASSPNVVS